jgi:hypothetical protein
VSALLGLGATGPTAVVCDCANQVYGPNQPVLVDGSCTTVSDSNHPVLTWEWDFNYQASTGFTPTATGARATLAAGFPAAGTRPVALRVTDDATPGNQSLAVCNVTVAPAPHCPHPNAGGVNAADYPGQTWLPARTYHASLNVPLQYDATGSFDPDGDPLTYEWDFHARSVFTADVTGATPTYTFSVPGVYPLAVRVTDHPSGGTACSRVDYATVWVGLAPPGWLGVMDGLP